MPNIMANPQLVMMGIAGIAAVFVLLIAFGVYAVATAPQARLKRRISAVVGDPLPMRGGLRWLRPRLVAIVEHAGETRELRDARFRTLRFDGRLDDCRIEEPIEMDSAPARSGTERPRLIVLQSLPFPTD